MLCSLSISRRFSSSFSLTNNLSPNLNSLLKTYLNIIESHTVDHLRLQRNPREIFANNHLRLSQVNVIGFDYDYTLCYYKSTVQELIYDIAKQRLVEKNRYPTEMMEFKYDKRFAIRGLTIDAKRGLLCKMTAHQKLAFHGVYRGRKRLTPEEIYDEYEGSRHIHIDYRDEHMKPLNDLFSYSQSCLYADVLQFFIDHDITYEPESVYGDIDDAIAHVHESGKMHKAIVQDLPKYVVQNPEMKALLTRMKENGKQLFLCTNSSFRYVDAGLRYMMGEDWKELFDVVMVNARKPEFYTRQRSFRLLDEEKQRVTWEPVHQLKKRKVYTQGSLSQLVDLTGWKGRQVLYIGDSLFSDLVEPNRKLGWRTGAIIRELEDEMVIQGTSDYQKLEFQVHALEELLRRVQSEISSTEQNGNFSVQDSELLASLVREHEALQLKMSNKINANFGSVFRTEIHPSQFAFSVQRYVDIYTSRLENMLEYPDNYTFYPQYQRLPHETQSDFHTISEYFDQKKH